MVKKITKLTPSLLALCLTMACSNEQPEPANSNQAASTDATAEGIRAIAAPIEYVPESDSESENTRSMLSYTSSGMKFSWEAGDMLTIYPESGAATAQYEVKEVHEDNHDASFQNTGFTLTAGSKYYALSKVENKTLHPGWSFPSKENITVDFSGQRQTENSSTATSHLGEYDFMASCVTAEADDRADLYFKHLGFTLRMVLNNLPTDGTTFTALEVYDSENTFRQPSRNLDMTKGGEGESYAPALSSPDINDESFLKSPRFKLLLGSDNNTADDLSDDPGMTADANGKITCYMELPPHDFTGKTMVFHLISKDGQNDYYGTYSGKKMEAGKAYQRNVTMTKATSYTITLKLNHIWQQGSTKEVTRATGDPGIDEALVMPTKLYYVWCVAGQVKEVNTKAFTTLSAASTDWTTTTDKSISTYNNTISFSVDNTEAEATKHLYVVASTTDLTGCFSSLLTTSSEDDVKALTYAIQHKDDQTASQKFLRDLYSTPWKSATAFVGDITDIYQDVVLYHTAAVVDLKWNSTTKMSGNVSIQNVCSSQLSLFTPANNATTGSANYTVSTPIDKGTMYNGRQVYYLPQFNSYNVTIGSKTSNIGFTPAEGFTSWLRALIQQ